MDISAKQLNDIRAAYAVGRLKPMVEITDRDLQAGVNDIEKIVVSPTDRAVLIRCSRCRSAALQACRQGDYAIADYLFSALGKLSQSEKLSPVGRLMAQSANEAAIAYLDYRYKRFEAGTERIYRALACDEILEKTYGYIGFHIHRIRLLLNLVRLKRRQGEIEDALHMSLALIDYLEQKVSSLPFPTTWDARCLDDLSLEQRNFLFERAICEMMFLVVGQEHPFEEVASVLSEHTQVASSPPCQLSPSSHLWLQARGALQGQQPDQFLNLILHLVAGGPNVAGWLWYGIAIDVVILCRTLSCEAAHLLVQDILDDMSSWRWSSLPPSWKQMFETISTCAHV